MPDLSFGKVKSFTTQGIILMNDFSHCIVSIYSCVCLLQWRWDSWGQGPGSRQCAMSSCWTNKRINESLYVWFGSVQYTNFKCAGLGNVVSLTLSEEHESLNFSCSYNEQKFSFYQWEILWNTALRILAACLQWHCTEGFTGLQKDTFLYSEDLLPKPVHIFPGEKMNEFVKYFMA